MLFWDSILLYSSCTSICLFFLPSKKTITWGIFQTTKKQIPERKTTHDPVDRWGFFWKKLTQDTEVSNQLRNSCDFGGNLFFGRAARPFEGKKKTGPESPPRIQDLFFLGGVCWEKQDIKIRASKICGNSYWKRIDIRKHFHWDVGRVHFSMSHSDQWISLNCIIYITARKAYFKDAAFLFGSINIIRSSCLEVYQISEAVLTWWNPSHTHHTHMVSKTIIPMDMWTSVGTSSEYDIDT